ncbi:MAG: PadR family transcriptional regulator [Propionibacteriaceae bacterium]
MSSIRLFILDSFARHGAMHGHQLRLQAEEERVHLWTDISVGSVYGTIKRLGTEGLIEEVRTERDGNFPERQVYDITPAGLEALARLRSDHLRELVVKPDPFDLALTRLDPDGLDDLPTVIAERLDTYEQRLRETERNHARAQPHLSLTEKFALRHRVHRLTAEIEWLRGLTEALPDIIADEKARRDDVNHPANQSVARPPSRASAQP